VTAADHQLIMQPAGDDPQAQSPPINARGPFRLRFRASSERGGDAEFFWQVAGSNGYSPKQRTAIAIAPGDWREYVITIPEQAAVESLRLDPPASGLKLQWIRIEAVPSQSKSDDPIRGEIVFHAHQDQLRLQVRATGTTAAMTVQLHWPGLGAEAVRVGGRIVLTFPNAVMLLPADATCDLAAGAIRFPLDTTLVIRGRNGTTPIDELFADDLTPLAAGSFGAHGASFVGYDRAAGVYVFNTLHRPDAVAFESAYRNPARRIESGLSVRNNQVPRRILIKSQTGVGNLEAAVAISESGLPLPLPVQVSKNFAGEHEEPDDTAFGDAYVPINLRPSASRELKLVHLFQGWGQSALKQVSSVRFFHIYWHLSTGASETTCFSMNWMDAGFKGAPDTTLFHIPDFRPTSGPTWADQPQRHCSQFPGFLQYNNGAGRLVYEYTTFDSIAPLLARFTMHFHTSDNAAHASLSVMETPMSDETRTFVHLRYDWDKPVAIEGDARLNFRLATMFEHQRPARLLWTAADGRTAAIDTRSDEATLLAEPIRADGAFLASHHGDAFPTTDHEFSSLILLRSFRARLAGSDDCRPAISARFSSKSGSYWLSVATPQLSLQPGDFVEADVMFMPHGEPAPQSWKPERERKFWTGGTGPTVEQVRIGTKLKDFPATVEADDRSIAALSLRGGNDRVPVIIENFATGATPLIWDELRWLNQQQDGGDYCQIEPGTNCDRLVFLRTIRPGQTQQVLVTAAQCREIAPRLRDDNGFLAIDTKASAILVLDAPRPFGPGTNHFEPKTQLYHFEGPGPLTRELPVDLVEAGQPGTLTVGSWDDDAIQFTLEGPGTIVPNASYISAGWHLRMEQKGLVRQFRLTR
jgi:hypothetical protein